MSCLLTSASVHDSQAALPLATITAGRVTNLYDLMDSAYDAPEIAQKSRALGHVPIIDPNPRRGGKADAEAEARAMRHVGHALAEDIRFKERSAVERVDQRSQGQLRGPLRACARSRQGVLPPDVRHPGAGRRTTDAPRDIARASMDTKPRGSCDSSRFNTRDARTKTPTWPRWPRQQPKNTSPNGKQTSRVVVRRELCKSLCSITTTRARIWP